MKEQWKFREKAVSLRTKITAVINRGGGLPDELCPEDPESVRYWVTTGLSSTEKDRLRISGEAQVDIAANEQSLGALMGQPNMMPDSFAPVGPGEIPLRAPDNAAMLGLVGGKSEKQSKGKPKAKPKAAVPATPADKKQHAGWQGGLSFNVRKAAVCFIN